MDGSGRGWNVTAGLIEIGIWALIAGVFQIVASFKVRNLPHLMDKAGRL